MNKHARFGVMMAVPLCASLLFGCGTTQSSNTSQNATAQSATTNAAEIQSFAATIKPHVQAINQDFSNQSNLLIQLSLKKITYGTFKSQYDKNQVQLTKEIGGVSSASAQNGASEFKTEYVSLMQQGAKLLQDQENAIHTNGTMDTKLSNNVKTELTKFQQDYKTFQDKYGLSTK